MPRQRDINEAMDAPDVHAGELRHALRFIRKINRRLGYNNATAAATRELGGGSVLDVCCGSADFAERAGSDYIGLDFHPTTLAVAREWQPDVTLVRGDARALPLSDDSVDIAICQMSLHHFDHEDVLRICGEMDRVSRRGWIAADLLNRRRARWWIWWFTVFSSKMIQDDARVSVRQAFTDQQARELGRQTKAEVRFVFGHRFLLIKRHSQPS